MKQLFVLKDLKSNQAIVEGLAFESKDKAKKERNKRNDALPENKDKPKEEKVVRFVVARGVDHDKGPSRRGDWHQPKTHNAKKKRKASAE